MIYLIYPYKVEHSNNCITVDTTLMKLTAKYECVHNRKETTGVPATCTTDEHIKSVCTKCKEEKLEKITKTGHSYGSGWNSDDSAHWHECSVCRDKKDRAGHTKDSGTVTKEPTKSETGTREYKCTVCKRAFSTETIPKLEYFYVNLLYTDNAKIEFVGRTPDVCNEEREGLTDLKGSTFTISCHPDAGYRFVGWKDCLTGKIVSTESMYLFVLESDCVLTAVVEKEHEHNYTSEWKNDADNHWHE